MRLQAAELISLPADVIVANGTEAVEPLALATRSVPIVFVQVSDRFFDMLRMPHGSP